MGKRCPSGLPSECSLAIEFLPVCPRGAILGAPQCQAHAAPWPHLSQPASSGRARLRWPKEPAEPGSRARGWFSTVQPLGFQWQGPRGDRFPEEGVCGSRRNIQIPFPSWVTGPGLPQLTVYALLGVFPNPAKRASSAPRWREELPPQISQVLPAGAPGSWLWCPFDVSILPQACPYFLVKQVLQAPSICSAPVLGSAIAPKHPVPFGEGSIKTQGLDVVCALTATAVSPLSSPLGGGSRKRTDHISIWMHFSIPACIENGDTGSPNSRPAPRGSFSVSSFHI